MNNLFTTIRTTAGVYAVSRVYVIGSLAIAAAVAGWVGVGTAIIIFGIAAIVEILLLTWREIRTVHRMVDGQTTQMLERIDDLARLLEAHGIHPPEEDDKVTEARQDASADV